MLDKWDWVSEELISNLRKENMNDQKESPEPMTIERALDLKRELEDKIYDLLAGYEEAVGVPVAGIGVDHCDDCDGLENVQVIVQLE